MEKLSSMFFARCCIVLIKARCVNMFQKTEAYIPTMDALWLCSFPKRLICKIIQEHHYMEASLLTFLGHYFCLIMGGGLEKFPKGMLIIVLIIISQGRMEIFCNYIFSLPTLLEFFKQRNKILPCCASLVEEDGIKFL